MANKGPKIFSCDQPCQYWVQCQRFGNLHLHGRCEKAVPSFKISAHNANEM
jgi:hypothetical protein